MQAVVFKNDEIIQQEIPQPAIQKGEALIRVLLSGICNTDIEITKGYMSFQGILGHEFVGVVEECNEEKWKNLRVVGEINCGCGECNYCRKGLSRHCPNRTVLGIQNRNGAHAHYVTLPTGNLHIVPEQVNNESAVFTEPLAAALEITEQVHLQPGMKVAVIGDGKLAQLVALLLRLYVVELTVIGKHESKMALLRERGIATQPKDRIQLPDQDVVIECSGSPAGLSLANSLLVPRGTLVLKSTYHGEFPFNPAYWVIHEINIIGSRCGPFAAALHLLEHQLIQPDHLISAIVPAPKALQAFEIAQKSDVLKVLIDWQ